MHKITRTIGLGMSAVALAMAAGHATAKDITIAYIANSMQFPYDAALGKGFQEECKKLGCKAIVIDPRASVERQGNAIDDLIAQKVDGIAMIATDAVVAVNWLDKVGDAKIPFVAAAAVIGDPDKIRQVNPKLTALVVTDDVTAGQRAGELAAKLLTKGKVAKIGIVEGAPGFAVVRQRTEGFRKALDAAGVKYEIVASQPTDWTPAKGESVCQNIMTANPDLDMFFSHADDMALGCARAIKAANSKVKLVSTGGGSKLGNDAIANGEFDGSVCTKPGTLGRLSARALFEAATGKNTKKGQFVTYETPAITKANLKDCPPEW